MSTIQTTYTSTFDSEKDISNFTIDVYCPYPKFHETRC